MKSWSQNRKTSRSMLPGWCKIQKKKALRLISVILVFAILNLSVACRSYFKVNSFNPPPSEKITGMKDAGKTIIVHFNDKKWVLNDVQVENNVVTGKLTKYNMPPTIKPVRIDKPNRYYAGPAKSKNQRYLLKEVHLYLNEFADMGNDLVSIPVGSISVIEVYDKDTAATVGSWVLGAVGGTLGAFAVFMIFVAIFKESCPFIYTWDGENYIFAGEIYSGTIHKPLERNDFIKLPAYPGRKSYTLKITNEVREIQNTNLLELLVIDHPKNVNVLVDKYGTVTTLSQPVAPSLATNLAGQNVTKLVASKDNLFYQSTSTLAKLPLKDGVILEFPNKGVTKTAKLAIRAKNAILLDYMLGQFHELFGSAYKGYMNKQQKSSATGMRQWTLDQGIPLSLYVERNNKWEFVDYYNIAGPMAFKEDVLTFPLKGNESTPLRVKLEYGNFLWEIDYASADFSSDQKVTSFIVPVKTAVTDENKDVKALLVKDDKNYYTQPSMDNQAVVTFDLPEQTGQSRTVVLHSKGWYQLLRNPSGKPDIEKLKAFRQPGHFNRFVNEELKKMEQRISQVQ
jgi:hypothetical protein